MPRHGPALASSCATSSPGTTTPAVTVTGPAAGGMLPASRRPRPRQRARREDDPDVAAGAVGGVKFTACDAPDAAQKTEDVCHTTRG
jgi:hypothetical protein